jgi:hypothetical protein
MRQVRAIFFKRANNVFAADELFVREPHALRVIKVLPLDEVLGDALVNNKSVI